MGAPAALDLMILLLNVSIYDFIARAYNWLQVGGTFKILQFEIFCVCWNTAP